MATQENRLLPLMRKHHKILRGNTLKHAERICGRLPENGNDQAKELYFNTFRYAINQGFAYGSGMGTNHHYGYQTRQIYISAWLMRNEIYQQPDKKRF